MKTSKLIVAILALLIVYPSFGESEKERKRRRRGSSGKKIGVSINLSALGGNALNFRAWDLALIHSDISVPGAIATWGLNGEYSPHGTSSFILSIQGNRINTSSYLLPGTITTNNDDFEFNGINISAQYRYYKDPSREGNTGVFYSPYLMFRSMNSGDTEFDISLANEIVQTEISQNAFGLGFMIGYVYSPESSPIFIDLQVGLGYFVSESFSTSINNPDAEKRLDNTFELGAYDARFGINLGYRFPLQQDR